MTKSYVKQTNKETNKQCWSGHKRENSDIDV